MTIEARLRPIAAAETRRLRHLVLRPHQSPETIVYDAEEDPDTLHIGAFLGPELIGTGTIHRDPPDRFRIRGMAVLEAQRGAGVGSAILERLIDHARSRGASLIWCNARVPALSFYERSGFVPVGERFDEPHIGPHSRMELYLI